MKLGDILDLITALAGLVPVPMVALLVPLLVKLVRDLEASGVFDPDADVDISTIGDAHRLALAELVAELRKSQP